MRDIEDALTIDGRAIGLPGAAREQVPGRATICTLIDARIPCTRVDCARRAAARVFIEDHECKPYRAVRAALPTQIAGGSGRDLLPGRGAIAAAPQAIARRGVIDNLPIIGINR
jgi:hypothetical protein